MVSTALQDEQPRMRWSANLGDLPAPAAPRAAAWLREPGLLTERLRARCGGVPGLAVVAEAEAPITPADATLLRVTESLAFVREIELTCDGRPWVYAQTLIPRATLARHRWLSTLGGAALGARLAAIAGIARGPLEFACLTAAAALYRRALRDRGDPPPEVWARRSWFAIHGDRLLVQEVFLPEAR